MLEELPPEKGGCVRAGLIGCGIVALLVVLIFVGGVLYVRKNPGALMDVAMTRIERNYGSDVTEDDKKELRAAVEDFKTAVRSKRFRDHGSFGFQRSFSTRSGTDKFSHADVQGLIRMFRDAVAKSDRPAGDMAPAPTMVPMAEPTRSP